RREVAQGETGGRAADRARPAARGRLTNGHREVPRDVLRVAARPDPEPREGSARLEFARLPHAALGAEEAGACQAGLGRLSRTATLVAVSVVVAGVLFWCCRPLPGYD